MKRLSAAASANAAARASCHRSEAGVRARRRGKQHHAYAEWNTDSVRTKNRTIHEPPSPDKYIVVLSKSQDLDSIPPIGPRMAARRFVVGIVDSAMGRK
ncbi:putative thiamine-phosphate pyrophosphorylase [Burkholderia pseudomallei MSHR5569]|nr:putative thiamine-phosphate pyrophosphorylase [Burkholderia pseudomallei MSHR5569]